MPDAGPHEITQLLIRAERGDALASEALLPLLYDELRSMAKGCFRRQTPVQTLQPTALVHEAWLKLTGGREVGWESRAHFLAVASMAMRQILANHADRRRTGGTRIGRMTAP